MFWSKKRNYRYVDGSKDNLPKRLGDYSFGLSMAMSIAMFAEYVLEREANISDDLFLWCLAGVFVCFVSGIFFYKKGGL
jgi:peptidoglycan/LPS O-acetylase OafA/YrhL